MTCDETLVILRLLNAQAEIHMYKWDVERWHEYEKSGKTSAPLMVAYDYDRSYERAHESRLWPQLPGRINCLEWLEGPEYVDPVATARSRFPLGVLSLSNSWITLDVASLIVAKDKVVADVREVFDLAMGRQSGSISCSAVP